MWLSRSPLLLLLLALEGCQPGPRTQLMVTVEADPSVASDTALVRVVVRGGPPGALVERYAEDVPVASWPLRVALVPVDRDATRRIEIEVSALRSTMEPPLVVVRAEAGFVLGRTLELPLRLEECCRTVSCDATQTCRGCACVSSEVEAGLLNDLFTDASVPPRDGGVPIVSEGAACDLAGITSACASGTACTCTGALGCGQSAEAPRCWAIRDIGCGRPIDLTERVARASRVELEVDGTGSPELIAGTCRVAAGEVVYVVRAPSTDLQLLASASVGMELWFGCDASMRWGGCTAPWSFMVPRGSAAYLLAEASGPHVLRVDRHSP